MSLVRLMLIGAVITSVADAAQNAPGKQKLTIVAFGDSTTAPRNTVKSVYADRLPGLLHPND